MRTFIPAALFCALLVAPVSVQAQNDDDPFADDPLFNRPTRDWFSADRITRVVKQRRDRIIRQSGVDNTYHDLTGYSQKPGFAALSSVKPMVRFNRVEGVALGVSSDELDWNQHDRFSPFGNIQYSFGREEWLYTIGAERLFGFNKSFKAGIEHHRTTDSDDGSRVGWNETSLTAFFAGYDYMDYYGRQGTSIYSIYNAMNAVEFTVMYRTDDIYNLERNTRYTMFGHKNTYRDNPAILIGADTARVSQVVAGLRLNPTDRMLTSRFSASLDVLAQLGKSVDGLDTEYAYDKLETELRALFIIDPAAALKIRARVGQIVGNPTQNAFFYLGGPGTVRSMRFKEQSGNAMVLFNGELLLGEDRGRRGDWLDELFDLDELQFKVFFDAGWVDSNPVIPQSFGTGFDSFSVKKLNTSLGVGLNANVLRFELAWPTRDLAGTPALWVRLNPSF
jgi:hypothetical protein